MSLLWDAIAQIIVGAALAHQQPETRGRAFCSNSKACPFTQRKRPSKYNPPSILGSAMQKAALLYIPDSGGRRNRRQSELESVLTLLRNAGVEAQLILTDSRAHAEESADRKSVV